MYPGARCLDANAPRHPVRPRPQPTATANRSPTRPPTPPLLLARRDSDLAAVRYTRRECPICTHFLPLVPAASQRFAFYSARVRPRVARPGGASGPSRPKRSSARRAPGRTRAVVVRQGNPRRQSHGPGPQIRPCSPRTLRRPPSSRPALDLRETADASEPAPTLRVRRPSRARTHATPCTRA